MYNPLINPLNYTNTKLINTKRLLVLVSFILVFISGLPLVVEGAEASLYLSPQQGVYEAGKTFSVNVLINSEGTAINAAQAKINFPPVILKVVDISKPNSIFTLWVQEPVWSNERGEISFGGGLPSPGFKGKTGKVMTIFFQGKIAGEAKVNFKEEAILENSPQALNIFSFSQEGNYSISKPAVIPPVIPKEIPAAPKTIPPVIPKEIPAAPEISSPTHPEPEKWYSNNNPEFQWKITSDIIGVSFAFNQIAVFDPGNVSQGIFNAKNFKEVADGVWYFHLKLQNEAGWGKTSHFKIKIENKAEVKIEPMPAPEITVCPSTFVSGEEVMYVSGSALPNSQVLIFLKKDEKLMKEWQITSNETGEWFLFEDDLFKSGLYQITAKTINSKGAITYESSLCSVKVILAGMAIGPLVMGYKTLTIIFLIIFILILAVIIYLLKKIGKSRELIEKETKDLKQKFYKEYEELRADIERELEELERARGERAISKAEKEREKELLENLTDIKKVFEKELKDIKK